MARFKDTVSEITVLVFVSAVSLISDVTMDRQLSLLNLCFSCITMENISHIFSQKRFLVVFVSLLILFLL